MANHASTCTTQLYDRRRDEVSRDEALSCWFSKNGRPEKIGAAGGRGQEWRQRARHRERYGRQRNQSSNDHARSVQRACRYLTSAARFSPHGPLGDRRLSARVEWQGRGERWSVRSRLWLINGNTLFRAAHDKLLVKIRARSHAALTGCMRFAQARGVAAPAPGLRRPRL